MTSDGQGIRGGTVFGRGDEYGNLVAENMVHVRYMHPSGRSV